MTILEDIQNAAIDGNSDLASILRKCKLLAARLNSKALEDWVIWESNGYPTDAEVPEYRIWSLDVLGDFAGPFGSGIKNARIPIDLLKFIPKESRETYKRWKCRLSIANIEETIRKSDRDKLSVTTGNLAVVIGTKLYQDQMYNCVHTWAEFGRGHLVELLNTVRNRILDFALAMEKENPSAGEKGDKNKVETIAPSKVTQIFNTTVYGGAASVVGTATDSPITLNLGTNDFSALERILLDKGIERNDVAELRAALDIEPVPPDPGGYGPKVSSWIGRMVEKAAQGSWQIGTGAAGDLLAKVIGQFYGL